ncbi:hypothetical protein WJX75_007943 [Coccomyxa subellipsoidea]|uniref:Uncharacterized protein n=1 Tax=Coccomyxa subellipsoidea TaxID=248742 RepID=A0ABR2Z547_9CHLO
MQAHQPVEWGAVERPAQDRCAQRMSLPTPPEATETADQPSPPLSPLEPPAHTAQTADSTADGAEEVPTATEATTRPPPTSTPSLQLNDEAWPRALVLARLAHLRSRPNLIASAGAHSALSSMRR